MAVRFGAYENCAYLTDTEASISVLSVACAVLAFIVASIITLVQPLLSKALE